MLAADMLPATYGNGRYLRRWSLIGGRPRCILPPLMLAEATPAELGAVAAENARLHALLEAAEAVEAAQSRIAAGAAVPEDQVLLDGADAATLALVTLRAGDASAEPVALALLDPQDQVVQVVAVDAGWAPVPPLRAVPAAPGARIGGHYADGVFTPPATPGPVPPEVTLRQLLLALVAQGWITEAEALAAARTGELPGSLAAMLPGLSAAEQFALRLTWAAMYSAERASPVWDLFIGAGVATADQVDALFRAAAEVA
ncbi:hypothetical protein [Falsiroseomonas selenitidurans]|uniref:Uncharacterized protein n=1 Tax=Falsiroseomonas selenitidurans TaxID=2716335 RepID=A0ABX1E0M8_9PROT|nr:hypothetical protein [Falsiroseomonas selenitidurans]NKC30210.1 hypothetical protein [Falsiroseomonas selenitidurans]